eukprot:GHVQ01016937.1.p1 GENE.GHVQ01016937.1~~GHVQ01016937.1.p1  ORF type:complete len:464 (+),score=101.22 GHVQ01016937.1:147-1538(+)
MSVYVSAFRNCFCNALCLVTHRCPLPSFTAVTEINRNVLSLPGTTAATTVSGATTAGATLTQTRDSGVRKAWVPIDCDSDGSCSTSAVAATDGTAMNIDGSGIGTTAGVADIMTRRNGCNEAARSASLTTTETDISGTATETATTTAGGTSEAATTEVAAAAADGESRYRDSPMVVAQASRKTTQISDAQITHAQIAAVAGQRVVDTRPVEQDSVLEVLATAMRVLRCAEKICPLDANTQQNLGVLLFILGHYDQALVYLCKATYNHATSFSLSSIHTLLSVAMDRCCNSLPSSPPHSPTSQNYSQHLPPPCQQPSTSPTNSPVPRSSLSLQLTGCTDSSATATQQTSTIVSTTTEASTTTPQPTTIAATTTSTTTSSATTSTKRPARATRTARGAPSCVGVVPALHSTTAARSPPRRSPRVAATDSDATCRGRGHNNRGGGGGLREGRGVGTGQGKKRGGRR